MSTLRAYQFLALLVKDVNNPAIIQTNGFEEYKVPTTELWTLDGEVIDYISISGEENGDIRLYLSTNHCVHFYNMDNKIENLKRYVEEPLPIVSDDWLKQNNVGYSYLLAQLKHQAIYNFTDNEQEEVLLDELIDESDMSKFVDPKLIHIMFSKTQEWCDDNIDEISSLIARYKIDTKIV